MTSREELVDLITSTAVAALDWHWDEAPGVPSPAESFRHVAEAIADALVPVVTTVEQLAELPTGTKLLGRTGEVWWRRESLTSPWQGSGGGYGSTNERLDEIHARFLHHEGPLLFLWRPS